MSGIADATAISAGADDACALLSTGGVNCWGYNEAGQLGDGNNVDGNLTPVAVSGLTNAAAITVGGDDACALLSTGGVECWGANNVGQLGIGTTTGAYTPVAVRGLP